jgi:hypothetical protein
MAVVGARTALAKRTPCCAANGGGGLKELVLFISFQEKYGRARGGGGSGEVAEACWRMRRGGGTQNAEARATHVGRQRTRGQTTQWARSAWAGSDAGPTWRRWVTPPPSPPPDPWPAPWGLGAPHTHMHTHARSQTSPWFAQGRKRLPCGRLGRTTTCGWRSASALGRRHTRCDQCAPRSPPRCNPPPRKATQDATTCAAATHTLRGC